MRTELCEMALRHGTDKCGAHDYTPYYHSLFKDRRGEVKKVLEIGIGDEAMQRDHVSWYKPGASLRMWTEYFPGAEVYCLELRQDLLINEGRIHSYLCDQSQEHSLRNAAMNHLGVDFDLIIDDGSHAPADQVLTAKVLVPLLAPGGIYIVEDVWMYPSYPWGPVAFGTKAEDIPYSSEVIGRNGREHGEHLIVIRRD